METDYGIQITSTQVTDELSEHMEVLSKVIKRGQNIKLLPTMFIVSFCCYTGKHYRNHFSAPGSNIFLITKPPNGISEHIWLDSEYMNGFRWVNVGGMSMQNCWKQDKNQNLATG